MRRSESEETRDALRAVIRAVEESSRSAGQLLDHATVVYRSDRMADAPVDLGALVSGQAEAFGPTAELKDVTLTTRGAEQTVTVSGDRALLESALRNLIDNAIKYSAPETEIDVTLTAGREAVIEVADRGRGLSGQGQSALARRFARGANAGDVVGSGLGLTIVEEVAAAHGGRFVIDEREGGGTCARLYLPLA